MAVKICNTFQDYAVRYWLKKGAPREKIVMGIPFYGRSFTLLNSSNSMPTAPIKGFGNEGRYTQVRHSSILLKLVRMISICTNNVYD